MFFLFFFTLQTTYNAVDYNKFSFVSVLIESHSDFLSHIILLYSLVQVLIFHKL